MVQQKSVLACCGLPFPEVFGVYTSEKTIKEICVLICKAPWPLASKEMGYSMLQRVNQNALQRNAKPQTSFTQGQLNGRPDWIYVLPRR